MHHHLWLIGMMGSGKTQLGPSLAARLGVPFRDVDEVVASRVGCSIAQFWGTRGEAAFRDMEAIAIDDISAGVPAVVSTGGGAVLREANVAVMRRTGKVVWLTAEPRTLATRVGDGGDRPLLHDGDVPERLEEILQARTDHYAAAADVAFATDDAMPDEVVDRIEVWWNEAS
jgi:shikimate kinase